MPIRSWLRDSRVSGGRDVFHKGVLYALLAYGSWGLAPLFWKHAGGLPANELIAERTLTSGLAFAALVALRGDLGGGLAHALKGPGHRTRFLLGAVLIGVSWFAYLYAVFSAQLVEASLGYFINPLVNLALGTLVLRERLTRLQALATLLATGGVLLLALRIQGVPWIALTLALSFGAYGLLRKTLDVDALAASTLEMLALLPFAVGYLGWLAAQHRLVFAPMTAGPGGWLFLLGTGPVTALPLLWFSMAARRLSLGTLGFLQYLAPTVQLAIAVLLYDEPFTSTHAASFGLIWGAIALYTWDLRSRRRVDPTPRQSVVY